MGREMNDKLARRLTDSIAYAHGVIQYALVTDMENSKHALVELIRGDAVVFEFFVKMGRQPQPPLRYRDRVDLGPLLAGIPGLPATNTRAAEVTEIIAAYRAHKEVIVHVVPHTGWIVMQCPTCGAGSIMPPRTEPTP